MPRYVRAFVPGGTFFFTVATLERRRGLLVPHVDLLRRAFAAGQARHPFRIDAIVVLPDHLHCIWTLPPDDADFSSRWHTIKSSFSRATPSGCTTLEHRAPVRAWSGYRTRGPVNTRSAGVY
jgi:putative transposase